MSNIKLTPEEGEYLYSYLREVLTQIDDKDHYALQIIGVLISKTTEKLHGKLFLRKPISWKLPTECLMALQYVMCVYPVPADYTYTSNVIRVVQQQLPNIETNKLHQLPLSLKAAPQSLNHG